NCTVTLGVASIPADKEVGVCPTTVTVALQPDQSFLDADFCVRLRDVCSGVLEVLWDLDLCYAGSSYNEFTPAVTGVCQSFFDSATTVYRESGSHSCTDDRNGQHGRAMCVSASSSSTFVPDSSKAVRFSVDVQGDGKLLSLSFWELAPNNYLYSSGSSNSTQSGANNEPRLFGVRVLRDGVVIFSATNLPTDYAWTLKEFPFSGPDFMVSGGSATFEFELLAYAPINPWSSSTSVWDLDDIKVEFCCTDCDGDGTPNTAESDCDGNGIADDCESFADCNGNGIPDACDIADGTSTDVDGNGIPDECAKITCIEAAQGDGIVTSDNHAIWLSFGGSTTKTFVFDPPAELHEFPDGTAWLTGVAHRKDNPSQQLVVDVNFSGRLNPGDPGHAPSGSPAISSSSPALASNGGAAVPGNWYYYVETTGTFTGAGSLDGLVVQVSRRGPAFQVGTGANQKNMHFGASGWLDLTTLSQPNSGSWYPWDFEGDFNLDFVICEAEGADNCSEATDLECCLGKVDFDVTYASTDGSSSSTCHYFNNGQVYNDVWYRWTAPCDGDYRFSTVGLTSVDTKIAVYEDGPCGSLGSPEACNDDALGTYQSVVNIWAPAGTTFLIRLGTFYSNADGDGQMSISVVTPLCMPTACGN
ncbi:MAG: hypothetical protein AB7O52_18400, partial [Planctomycetota bacterium]